MKDKHGSVECQHIRVVGTVQGVGFRPYVWKLARKHGVTGSVINDGLGVLIEVWADDETMVRFVEDIKTNDLPLARIEHLTLSKISGKHRAPESFHIASSISGDVKTRVATDAATCFACIKDTLDPTDRRYRYPFTNCTHCGPRLSIVRAIPYDRSNTSMCAFPLCDDCRKEYIDPENRRFHAQPNACPRCGPTTQLVTQGGELVPFSTIEFPDSVAAAAALIKKGKIVAIKGVGGFHLACDAANHVSVGQLRDRKKRFAKPFALMARDPDVVRRYCALRDEEMRLLLSPTSPIVLLDALKALSLSPLIAPGQRTLGFMLPYTPLHHLLMESFDTPIVLTSGNISDEPQCTDNDDACERLAGIADYILLHNRTIVNRVDDSIVRLYEGAVRVLRRGRGYAPEPISLPTGFENSPAVLAMGAELKNTICFVRDGAAILTQHIGDLEDARTYTDYLKNMQLYEQLFQHEANHVAVDMHPEYLSTKYGKSLAIKRDKTLHEVQHHHAHAAACLVDNNWALDATPVLAVALDGLGYGSDGTLWGGEFLEVDYISCKRIACFKPVPLLGGAQAMREPWRNTYAHIVDSLGWERFLEEFGALELTAFLKSKPLATLDGMIRTRLNAPVSTSCGRLFDAVAGAVGICRNKAQYEGQAAIELEAAIDLQELHSVDSSGYPFDISSRFDIKLPYLDPQRAWQRVFGDMMLQTPTGVISARFHKGLGAAIVNMVAHLSADAGIRRFDTIALTGGVFQNTCLFSLVSQGLRQKKFRVLSHRAIPPNDAGISLGQGVIAAARAMVGGGR